MSNIFSAKSFFKVAFIMLATWVLFPACNNDDEGNSDNNESRRTLIIYMSAQNSLGYEKASTMDSTEIIDGAKQLADKDNIVLYLDDAKIPRLYKFYKQGKDLYYKVLKKYTYDADSSDPETLSEVLRIAKQSCPSQSYGLVLWSHGTGWLPNITSLQGIPSNPNSMRKPTAFGIDVGPEGGLSSNHTAEGILGPQMPISDLAKAIRNSGTHMDYIVFDACMMQGIEVAYDLRDVTTYIVASPAFTSGYGCDYQDQIMKAFFAYPSNDENIKKIADTYYYTVMENPQTKHLYSDQGCIISVVKTGQLEALAQTTARYMGSIIQKGSDIEIPKKYDYIDYDHTGYPNAYDISSVMSMLMSPTNYQAWKEVLDRTVIYHRASPSFIYGFRGSNTYINNLDTEHLCGMSMFIPNEKYTKAPAFINYNEAFTQTSWYKDAGWAQTGW